MWKVKCSSCVEGLEPLGKRDFEKKTVAEVVKTKKQGICLVSYIQFEERHILWMKKTNKLY